MTNRKFRFLRRTDSHVEQCLPIVAGAKVPRRTTGVAPHKFSAIRNSGKGGAARSANLKTTIPNIQFVEKSVELTFRRDKRSVHQIAKATIFIFRSYRPSLKMKLLVAVGPGLSHFIT
jgi:hypothetical protein